MRRKNTKIHSTKIFYTLQRGNYKSGANVLSKEMSWVHCSPLAFLLLHNTHTHFFYYSVFMNKLSHSQQAQVFLLWIFMFIFFFVFINNLFCCCCFVLCDNFTRRRSLLTLLARTYTHIPIFPLSVW